MVSINPTPTTQQELPQALLDALGSELQNYELLLTLLKEHQQCIINRNSERITEINSTIDEQVQKIETLRSNREKVSAELLMFLDLDPELPLSDALALLAQDIAKSIKEAIANLVALISKSQYIAKQNQILIKRAALITEQLLSSFSPKKSNKTYNCPKEKTSSFNTLGLINASA